MWCLIVSTPDLCPLSYFQIIVCNSNLLLHLNQCLNVNNITFKMFSYLNIKYNLFNFLGYANLGEICTVRSQSVVEDHFNFLSVTIFTHELGHR